MTDQNLRYNNVAIGLHWLIGLLMMFMLFFGEGLIQRVQGTFYPSVHVSLGIAILVLSVARLAWRMMNPPPALPDTMKPWEKIVSHITHWAFYILMIGMPLTGMMDISNAAVRNANLLHASVFGLFNVPTIPNVLGLGGAHSLGAVVGKILVILHVGAALKHQFWNKDGLLRRMSPR
jgi:cytochrome b561